jgi:hypothetical protein
MQGLKLKCLIDGVLQVYISDISFEIDGKKTAVETMESVVAYVQSSPMFSLDATWAWLSSGPEVNIVDWSIELSEHDVQIPLGNGKSLISTGQFMNCGGSASVGNAATIKATFSGVARKPR